LAIVLSSGRVLADALQVEVQDGALKSCAVFQGDTADADRSTWATFINDTSLTSEHGAGRADISGTGTTNGS